MPVLAGAALRFVDGGVTGAGARLAYCGAVLAFFPAGGAADGGAAGTADGAPSLLKYSGGDEVTLTGYVARSGSLRAGRDPHESLDWRWSRRSLRVNQQNR